MLRTKSQVSYRTIGPLVIIAVTSDVLQYNSVMLVCEGLDTVSTVFINNRSVGTSDNMFVRYTYNVKPYLKVNKSSAQYFMGKSSLKRLL